MSTESIEVRESWGGIVVEAERGGGFRERWWFAVTAGSGEPVEERGTDSSKFHETDAGRLVLAGHVREYDESQHDFPVAGRHFTRRDELSVTREVVDALRRDGYDGDLYVQRGRRAESVERLEEP